MASRTRSRARRRILGPVVALGLVLFAIVAWLAGEGGRGAAVGAARRGTTAGDGGAANAGSAGAELAEPSPRAAVDASGGARNAAEPSGARAAPERSAAPPWTVAVTDTAGRPLAEARVVVELAGEVVDPRVVEAAADARGEVEVDLSGDRVAGRELSVRARADGHVRSRARVVPEPGERFELALSPSTFVTGRAVRPSGEPYASATLELRDGDRRIARTGSDEEDGRFAFELEEGGTLRLEAADRLRARGRPREVHAVPGATTDVGDVVLRELGVVEGTVRLPDGLPAPDLGLSVDPVGADRRAGWPGTGTRTDEEGRFRIAGLEEGRFALRAGDDDHPFAFEPSGPFETGGPALDLTVRARRLDLVPAPGGAPIVGYRLEWRGSGGARDDWRSYTPAGKALYRTYLPEVAETVEVAGEDADGTSLAGARGFARDDWRGRLVLDVDRSAAAPTGSIVARLEGPAEVIPATAGFWLTAEDGEWYSTDWSRADGAWTADVPPGRWNVHFRYRSYADVDPHTCPVRDEQEVVVPPNGEGEVAFRFRLGGSVQVDLAEIDAELDEHVYPLVVGADGEELDLMWTHDLSKGRRSGGLSVGDAWRSLPGIAPGTYELVVEAPRHEPYRTTVSIAAGETTEVAPVLLPE